MMLNKKSQTGFTIVELLIVVVVIAILAAITIVSYNGIQNRANDASVQADLRSNGQAIEQYYVLNNTYPSTVTHLRDSVKLKINKDAVSTVFENSAIYCSADGKFSLALLSKSGKGYYYSHNSGGVKEFPSVWSNSSTVLCPAAGGIVASDTNYLVTWLRVNSNWLTWL